MRWSERQVALLGAMGVRLWQPAASDDAASAVAVAEAPPPAVRAVAAATVARVEPPAASIGPPGSTPMTADAAAFRRVVATCTACALQASRTGAVFGSGAVRADWMVVGDAPGEAEDRDGTPFVGPSGLLLDNMLRAIGLSRGAAEGVDDDPAHRVFVTNVLKCRPPADRPPTPDEFARCEPHLLRQIDLVRPRMLLAMGRFAVSMLLRSSEPVGRLRGRVHRYHGVPLVVTYHPSVLLRNLEEKAKAWDDLCLAVEALEAVG